MPSLRCYPSHGSIVGGYGIPAIPTPPSEVLPQISRMLTEASGVEEPPTDFTDAHRWLGYVGFSHGNHGIHRLGGYGIPAIPTPPSEVLPQISQISQMVRLRRVLPRNSQKFLAEKSLPQISQMHTDG